MKKLNTHTNIECYIIYEEMSLIFCHLWRLWDEPYAIKIWWLLNTYLSRTMASYLICCSVQWNIYLTLGYLIIIGHLGLCKVCIVIDRTIMLQLLHWSHFSTLKPCFLYTGVLSVSTHNFEELGKFHQLWVVVC